MGTGSLWTATTGDRGTALRHGHCGWAAHPLVGGMPVEAAWTSLELLTGNVQPAVS